MQAHWMLNYGIKGGPIYDADSFHVLGTMTAEVEISVPGYEGMLISIDYHVTEMTRLAHCNAPEMSTPTGKAAQASVVAWFGERFGAGEPIPLVTLGRDKYKRLLCDVVLSDGSKLSDFVLSLPGTVPMSVQQQMRLP
jgi:hypothetical protein